MCEGSKNSKTAQTIQTVANREDIEEGSEDGKDDDGNKVVEKCLIVQSKCSVKNNGWKKNVEEEAGGEVWKRTFRMILNMEDVIENDVVDKSANKNPNNDENARLGENFGEPVKVMEDDLENNCKYNHAREHNG